MPISTTLFYIGIDVTINQCKENKLYESLSILSNPGWIADLPCSAMSSYSSLLAAARTRGEAARAERAVEGEEGEVGKVRGVREMAGEVQRIIARSVLLVLVVSVQAVQAVVEGAIVQAGDGATESSE